MEGVCACVKVVRRGRMTRTDTHTLAGFNMFRTSIVASDVQREQGYTHTVLETASKGDLPQEARTGFIWMLGEGGAHNSVEFRLICRNLRSRSACFTLLHFL